MYICFRPCPSLCLLIYGCLSQKNQTDAIPPVFIGGYYTGIKGWEFSVEGYYKDMYNVLEYKDGVSFFGSSTGWESKVEMGKGRSMGIEFMAQKTLGKTTGWLSYTLSKSDRKFAKGAINNGERFPYKYDRRHIINLTLNHKFSERIDIGASWVFYTGGTSTIPEEKQPSSVPVMEQTMALFWDSITTTILFITIPLMLERPIT